MTTLPRVLCVDDEPKVLDGLRRNLRREFQLVTAHSGAAGLAAVEKEEPFSVVVSDLRMPEMNGIEFLSRIREADPDTSRVLLTGDADLRAAMDAVNHGNIFRFLTKPCPAKDLAGALHAAVEHHRLVTAERELLEKTLNGAVHMLMEVLALASPELFGRATRVKQHAGKVAEALGRPERWKMELAAMLSQAACVTLPPETLERLDQGEEPSPADGEMLARLPEVAERLLADIPRLDDVKEIIRHHRRGRGGAAEGAPVGAHVLSAVLDFDQLSTQGVPPETALETLRSSGVYDAEVLVALASCEDSAVVEEIREVPLANLHSGMVLVDAVEAQDGRLLVASGQEVSLGLLERLNNFARNVGVKEPLRVVVRSDAGEAS